MSVCEEYREFTDICEKFVSREIEPRALEADLNPASSWVEEVWMHSVKIGLPGLLIPEGAGGMGESVLCAAVMLDRISAGCPGVASLFAHHLTACHLLARSSSSVATRFIPLFAPAGGDAPAMITVIFPLHEGDDGPRIVPQGSGSVLRGKTGLTGNAALAGHFCLFVREEDGGVTGLVIDRNDAEISLGRDACLPGLKVNTFAPLIFDDLEIRPSSLLGERGSCSGLMEDARDAFMVFVAAMAAGAAERALTMARAYAEERYQSGRIIIHHQEIQRMLGCMEMKLHVAAAAYRQARQDGHRDGLFAKVYCTDAALETVIDAIQIHGGYGYMHEYGLEKLMRDCKTLQLLGGSNPALLIDKVSSSIGNGNSRGET